MNTSQLSLKTNIRRLNIRHQQGFSITELMISAFLGLILLIAILTSFSSMSGTFKWQDAKSRAQENALMAMDELSGSFRMAGFYGLSADGNQRDTSIGTVTTSTSTDCTGTANWAFRTGSPIEYFPAVAAADQPTTMPCINTANFVGGSSILVVRHTEADITAAGALNGNQVYLQGDPSTFIMFYGSEYAGLLSSNKHRTLLNGSPAPIFLYRTDIYYIRPCARPTGPNGACQGTDDNGSPIPTLVKQELQSSNPSSFSETSIATGIDAIGYVFGIDDNSNGTPDRYTATPTLADLNSAVAIQVSVLARTSTLDPHYDDSVKTYDLGDSTFNCSAKGVTCSVRRNLYSKTLQIRNISFRNGGA